MSGDPKKPEPAPAPTDLSEALAETERLRQENAALKAAADKRDSDARNAAAVSFAEGLIGDGKLAPAAKDGVVAIHMRLAEGEAFEFSDGAKADPLKTFTGLFDKAQPLVNLGEAAPGDQETVEVDGESAISLSERAVAIVTAKGGDPKDPDQLAAAIRQAEEEARK